MPNGTGEGADHAQPSHTASRSAQPKANSVTLADLASGQPDPHVVAPDRMGRVRGFVEPPDAH